MTDAQYKSLAALAASIGSTLEENTRLRAELAEMTAQRDAYKTNCETSAKMREGLRHDLKETERERDGYAAKVKELEDDALRAGLAESDHDKDILIASLQRQVREGYERLGRITEKLMEV